MHTQTASEIIAPAFKYKHRRRTPGKPGTRHVSRRPIIQLAPRISGLTALSETGRHFDMVGLAKAIVATCGERILREIEDKDVARRASLMDVARYWHEIAVNAAKIAPEQARKLATFDDPPEEKILPFNLGEFRRREEPK